MRKSKDWISKEKPLRSKIKESFKKLKSKEKKLKSNKNTKKPFQHTFPPPSNILLQFKSPNSPIHFIIFYFCIKPKAHMYHSTLRCINVS